MGTSGPLPVWLNQRSLHCVPCFSAGLSVLASFATFLVFGHRVCFFCSRHWGQTHWGLGRRCQGPGQMLSPCLSLPPRLSKSVGVRRRSSNMAHVPLGKGVNVCWATPRVLLESGCTQVGPGSRVEDLGARFTVAKPGSSSDAACQPGWHRRPGSSLPRGSSSSPWAATLEVNSWHHKLGRLFPLQPIDPGEVPFGRERHQSQLIYLKTLSRNNEETPEKLTAKPHSQPTL